MKFILTNDDGIEAPGLQALRSCVEQWGDVVVVAPEKAQSGASHSITLGGALVVNEIENNHYSVQGKPADCSRVALKALAPNADWLIAGINPGANLGSDIYNSGTVAAAREAAILGCRAMAISQYVAREQQIDWEITQFHADRALAAILREELIKGDFWNINLPHPLTMASRPEMVFCPPDKNPHQYRLRKENSTYYYEGTIHDRPRDKDRDVAVCFSGSISISKLSI